MSSRFMTSSRHFQEKAAQLEHASIGIAVGDPNVVPYLKTGFGAQTIEANAVVNGTTCDVACRIECGRPGPAVCTVSSPLKLHIPTRSVAPAHNGWPGAAQ